MITKRFFISGRVQGVSFRYYTQRAANRLGIKGFVRNLPDGRVEVLARADEEALSEFYSFLRDGPPAARVDHIETKEETSDQELHSFQIKF